MFEAVSSPRGAGGLAPISVYSKFGTSRNDKTKDNDAKTNHNVQI